MPMKDSSDKGLDREQVKDPVSSGQLLVEGKVEKQEEPDLFDVSVNEHTENIKPEDLALTLEYANKPVVGAENYTREEYVREAIVFKEWNEETRTGVPLVVQDELRDVLHGLCAQESRFNASKESSAGAKGILQIMPNIWKYYGGLPGEETSLVKQVEIAGLFISDIYKQLNHRLGEETLEKLRAQFVDEDSFQLDFMVPLVINSYQTGDGRMAEAVQLYLDKTTLDKTTQGKELFVAITDFANNSEEGKYLKGYGDDSEDYTKKVWAFALAMEGNQG